MYTFIPNQKLYMYIMYTKYLKLLITLFFTFTCTGLRKVPNQSQVQFISTVHLPEMQGGRKEVGSSSNAHSICF